MFLAALGPLFFSSEHLWVVDNCRSEGVDGPAISNRGLASLAHSRSRTARAMIGAPYRCLRVR
jgi:hypothetical protein